jgi:hypothetical protein
MQDEQPETEEAPPVLGSWNRLYAVVIGFLVVQILLYWALSEWAA